MQGFSLVLLVLLLAACGGAPASGKCGSCGPPGAGGLAGAGPPRTPKLEALASRRVELSRKRLLGLRASFDAGKTTIEELVAGSRDVAFAARDSGMRGQALLRVLTEYRDAVSAVRDLMRERASKGLAVDDDALSRVESQVAEAQFWVEEAKQGS